MLMPQRPNDPCRENEQRTLCLARRLDPLPCNIGLFAIVTLVSCTASSCKAAAPDAWAALMKHESAACIASTGLTNARACKPTDFSDNMLIPVDGRWQQPHMKNATARFACLYDKCAQTAEAVKWVR